MFVFPVQVSPAGKDVIPDLLGQGFGVWGGAVSKKKFGCKGVYDDSPWKVGVLLG